MLSCCLQVPCDIDLTELTSLLTDRADFLFIDRAIADSRSDIGGLFKMLSGTRTLIYDEYGTWLSCALAQLSDLIPLTAETHVLLVGDFASDVQLFDWLAIFGCQAFMAASTNNQDQDPHLTGIPSLSVEEIAERTVHIVICRSRERIVLKSDLSKSIPSGAIVLDVGMGSIEGAAASLLIERGCQLIRVDAAPSRDGLVAFVESSVHIRQKVQGSLRISGVDVIAGGHFGSSGAVIVDSISRPTHVIGIADGAGRTLRKPLTEDQLVAIQKVEAFIREAS